MCDRSYDQVEDCVQNETYENDIRYTFQLCQWVLKPIGVWPFIYSRTSRREKIISIPLIIMSVFIMLFVVVPTGYYILFQAKDTNVKVKLLGPVGFAVVSTTKYCYFGIKRSAFKRCFQHVERDWKSLQDRNHRDIMIRNVTVGRNLTIICAVFLYIAGISYNVAVPLLRRVKINETFTFRPLSYPGYDRFVNTQASPTYEIMFCLLLLHSLVKYNITTAGCSLAAIFVTHACGQMQVQMARLEDLLKEKNEEKFVKDPLAIIIRNHVEVLRFSRNVEDLMHEICLMEVMASTLIICLLEYYCLMEWENSDAIAICTYAALLASFIFNILIFCYIGELLLEQGSKIGEVSYGIEWYNLSVKRARYLILLIAMSKYPPKLTAGKIFDLSMTTFGDVLKSSGVYLNLLRTVTE